jgi:hypothetical protein
MGAKGRKLALVACAAFALVAVVGTAQAIKLRAGDILIYADGGFAPTKLPRHENAPITIHGGGRVSTVSGGLPPILETIDIEFDRHGAVDTKGLPVCREGRLEATTVSQARAACRGAIVGKGKGSAIIKFPEQAPIPASSPITIFNGPKKHGNPTVLAHANLKKPVPTTFIVPIVIERIHKGIYGYRTKGRIPKIANGAGVPIKGFLKIGKRWTFKGKKHSYISARCENGRLQARGKFRFKDGTFLSGTFLRPCQVRR